MQKQQNNLFKSLSKEDLATLTTSVVKETIAADFSMNEQKIFSSAELWNIQRNKRRFSGRRRFFV